MTFADSMQPGCDCCEGCTYATDDFNRANGDPGANWYRSSSAVAINGNKLEFSAADEFAVFQTPHPDSTVFSDENTDWDWSSPTFGDQRRIHLDNTSLTDIDNSHFAQIEYVDASPDPPQLELTIWNMTAGTPTMLAGPFQYAIGNDLRAHIGICDASEDVFFVASTAAGSELRVVITPHGGLYAALSVGTLASGTATADNFELSRSWIPDSAPDEDCPRCRTDCDAFCADGNLLADPILLTVPSVDSYLLQRDFPPFTSDCSRWGGSIFGGDPTVQFVEFGFVDLGGGVIKMAMNLTSGDGFGYGYESDDLGPPPFDCTQQVAMHCTSGATASIYDSVLNQDLFIN